MYNIPGQHNTHHSGAHVSLLNSKVCFSSGACDVELKFNGVLSAVRFLWSLGGVAGLTASSEGCFSLCSQWVLAKSHLKRRTSSLLWAFSLDTFAILQTQEKRIPWYFTDGLNSSWTISDRLWMMANLLMTRKNLCSWLLTTCNHRLRKLLARLEEGFLSCSWSSHNVNAMIMTRCHTL